MSKYARSVLVNLLKVCLKSVTEDSVWLWEELYWISSHVRLLSQKNLISRLEQLFPFYFHLLSRNYQDKEVSFRPIEEHFLLHHNLPGHIVPEYTAFMESMCPSAYRLYEWMSLGHKRLRIQIQDLILDLIILTF